MVSRIFSPAPTFLRGKKMRGPATEISPYLYKPEKENAMRKFAVFISVLVLIVAVFVGTTVAMARPLSQSTFPFQNYTLPLDTRVSDLVTRLTQAEKISLLHQWQPAISRLGIASFRTGTEGLHGIAWLGNATVYPQAIGLGSTWDTALLNQVGQGIGDEARGYHAQNPTNVGLSVWSPVVDLERDPRAGRHEEGYAEDAYLTGQMAIAYSNGMTGGDAFYYKAIPTLKHFMAYNQEANRDTINVSLDARNLNEYYLEAFRYPIASGAAKSMMTSYNKVNGVPNTVATQINSVIRTLWNPLDFFVVSDAFAPNNLYNSQGFYSSYAQATAGMIKAGNCSFTQDDTNTTPTINAINSALSQGLITVADIDKCVTQILRVRFHTGEFDNPVNPANPYKNLGTEQIASSAHDTVALQAAREAAVLLKNTGNILPLSKTISVAVIGPRADDNLLDFYSGTMPHSVTPRAGITAKGVTVRYALDNTNNAAANAAAASNVAIVFLGNKPLCENGGWAGTCRASEGKETIDRQSIDIEAGDLSLLQAVFAANPNTIVVLVSSFPYSQTNWPNVPAILYTAHGGQNAGTAIADVLFGDYAPAGRLSTTWYSSLAQLPAITNYDIITGHRTYMYFNNTPLYAFGHGLTYATFAYSNLRLSSSSMTDTGQVTVSVDVTNTGTKASDEVVQLYEHDQAASVTVPMKKLVGFQRLNFTPGQMRTVNFTLPARELAYWSTSTNSFFVEPGAFDIMVGRASNNIQLTTTLTVTSGGGNPTNTPTRTSVVTNTPTRTFTPTAPITNTPTRTNTPGTPVITNTPTRTFTPGTPVITNTPTRTFTPTAPPVITNTPTTGASPTRTFTPTTGPTLTVTPTVGGACSPVTSTITIPFIFDGAGVFCWQASSLGGFINSWNTTSVSVNGMNVTNIWVGSGSYPAKINGFYYVSYNSAVAWGHFEAK
jgi:beta-glucosidase